MSKNRSRFNSKNKGKSVPKQDSVLSGSQPPPPPTRSRSFEELRRQVEDLKTQNEKLKNQMDQKPQPTASEIAQRNPNRANPNPDQAPIKLDQYATDWLEEEHANVIVDLSDDFEDYPIEQHANVIESENSVLLGMPQEDVNRLVNGFKAFSVLNICYRLLLTLPGTARIEAQQLISTLKADDVPENTPLLVEMSSHLGKTKTENYGNIRINHQLHVAKKRILKAMSYVWNVKTFRHELTCRPNRRLNELFSDDVWKKGVFLDRDSLTWLKHDAKIYLDLTAEKDYKFKINGESYLFGIPSFQEPKWTKNGKYRPDASFVKKYIKRIGWLADEKERNHIAAAMIIQTLDYSFVKARTMSLAEYDTTWRDTIYANANFENICEFLGSIILDDIVNDKDLAENYGVISTTYRTLLESKVKMTFKTVPLKKDEFGTEALLLENPEWTKGDIPYVKSSFKVHNTNNIVASGIFGFSKGVKFTISDKMYLKSPVRNIISDMLNKYCRKK